LKLRARKASGFISSRVERQSGVTGAARQVGDKVAMRSLLSADLVRDLAGFALDSPVQPSVRVLL
jgi:hypothetical protein